jgi:hypothetical protein
MTAAYPKTTTDSHLFFAAREQLRGMERHLESAKALEASHHEIEAYVVEQGRELQRRLLQAHLDLRAALERRVEVRGADGIERSHLRRESFRPLVTITGEVRQTRFAYQARAGGSLHPADAVLNLPTEVYSLGMRQMAAVEASKGSFDEAAEQIRNVTGVPIGKRQVEELARRAATDVEQFYKSRVVEPEKGDDLLVLTFDGKGIVMRTEDLRPETRRRAQESKRKLRTRLTKGEKRHRKRVAQVAAVYSIEAWPRTAADIFKDLRPVRDAAAKRPRPYNKRVWASGEREPEHVIEEAFREALRRDPKLRRRWVVPVDGNRDQIRIIKKVAKKHGVNITLVLDLIHVIEYLWRAAHSFYEAGSEKAESWVEQWLLALLTGRSGGYVSTAIRRLVALRGLVGKKRKTALAAAKYLRNNSRFMNYERVLAAGLPISTGVIEGACRHLIKDRMDRTGARWSLVGAEPILKLRSVRSSGDFEAYWPFHLACELERNHASHYAGKVVPCPSRATRPTLRRVK